MHLCLPYARAARRAPRATPVTANDCIFRILDYDFHYAAAVPPHGMAWWPAQIRSHGAQVDHINDHESMTPLWHVPVDPLALPLLPCICAHQPSHALRDARTKTRPRAAGPCAPPLLVHPRFQLPPSTTASSSVSLSRRAPLRCGRGAASRPSSYGLLQFLSLPPHPTPTPSRARHFEATSSASARCKSLITALPPASGSAGETACRCLRRASA